MKQIKYTPKQKMVIKIFDLVARHIPASRVSNAFKDVKSFYHIPDPLLTLRDYILAKGYGAYHTFHFNLNGKDISVSCIDEFLTDDLCAYYAFTKNYYVTRDQQKDNEGDCENYHCDHYLTLEEKED